jgi:hypothetical protein
LPEEILQAFPPQAPTDTTLQHELARDESSARLAPGSRSAGDVISSINRVAYAQSAFIFPIRMTPVDGQQMPNLDSTPWRIFNHFPAQYLLIPRQILTRELK